MPKAIQLVAAIVLLSAFASAAEEITQVQPVYFRQVKLNGFWKQQVKLLTEKWIPHCIKEMEPGGKGQELLNLVNTAHVLRGEPLEGKYTGCQIGRAHV